MGRVKTYRARVASNRRHVLAEGPLWDAVRERLLWVDLELGEVHTGALDGDTIVPGEVLEFGGLAGAVLLADDGTLLVAGRRGLFTQLPSGERRSGPQLIADDVDSRLNDAACDPSGRLVVGGMSLDGRSGGEHLWRIADSGAVEVIDSDLTLSNGLGWSPDGRTMYSIDTEPGTVWARSQDPLTGALGPRRLAFPRIEGPPGTGPDGMCVDVAGNLWIAVWGTGEVRCHAPSGEVLAVVEVDAPHPSSVAFAGPDRDLLIITTASRDLSPDELLRYPHAGCLFSARVATAGVPTASWNNTLDTCETLDSPDQVRK